MIQATSDGIRLAVRLTPRAAQDRIDGPGNHADGKRILLARVRAVPEKGAANAALVKLVAKWLGVAASTVSLASGASARGKVLAIAGDPGILRQRVEDRLGRGSVTF